MPRVARLISLGAAFALGVLWLVAFPRTASACTCQRVSTTSAASKADAIFTGTVTAKSTIRTPEPGRTDIRFAVSRVYKGTVYADQVVASPLDDVACGLDPAVHSAWLIFASDTVAGSGDRMVFRLATRLCSGDLPGQDAPPYLGPGEPPIAGASDQAEQAALTDATVSRVLTVGGVSLLVLLAAAGIGIGLLWRPGRTST